MARHAHQPQAGSGEAASYHDYDYLHKQRGNAAHAAAGAAGHNGTAAHRHGEFAQPRGNSHQDYAAHASHAASHGGKTPRHGGRGLGVLTSILVVALVAVVSAGTWYLWSHREVQITVDGQEVTTHAGTTLQDLYELFQPEAVPGNLVSVGGNLLQSGAGDPVGATVDGATIAYADFPATVIGGGEEVAFTDGADLTEDYTTEIEETAPKLAFDVDDDVALNETGYQEGLVQYVEQWGYPGQVEWRTGAISGERVQGDVIQEVQDCVVRFCYVHPDDDRQLVALTFDDGPTNYTAQYLQILKEYDAHASFMMIGEQIEGFEDVLAESLAYGNQMGSHTWHHVNLATADAETELEQLADTREAIEDATGSTTTLLRPPYGNMTRQAWLQSGGNVSVSVIWTQDSLDWEQPGVDGIVAGATANMGTGSIVLMHDGGGDRDQDLEALPLVIRAWQDAGYEVVTVAELLASDSSIPAEVATGTQTMPEGAVWPTEFAE